MSQFSQTILPLFEVNRAEWLKEAREIAMLLGANGRAITVDDVREQCPPPENADPRVMGAVFDKAWQKVGYTNSTRSECHGRPIAQFRLAEFCKVAEQENSPK